MYSSFGFLFQNQSIMKKVSLVFIGLGLALFAFAGIVSGLRIPPGEEFFLGNNYHGAYKASVKNKGLTKVEISTKMINGEKLLIDTVNPGETHEYQLAKDQATVLKNLSKAVQANLLVKTKGDDNLSMTYEKWEEVKYK